MSSVTSSTRIFVKRARMPARRLSWVGERCWIITNAMPVSAGSGFSSAWVASMPPAEAPIATIGKGGPSSGVGGSPEAGSTFGFVSSCVPILRRGMGSLSIDEPGRGPREHIARNRGPSTGRGSGYRRALLYARIAPPAMAARSASELPTTKIMFPTIAL
jgi:hypothetical protein